jgi:hypothetical protein
MPATPVGFSLPLRPFSGKQDTGKTGHFRIFLCPYRINIPDLTEYKLRILNYLLCRPAANRKIRENGRRAHFRKINQEKPVQYIAAVLKLIFMGEKQSGQ